MGFVVESLLVFLGVLVLLRAWSYVAVYRLLRRSVYARRRWVRVREAEVVPPVRAAFSEPQAALERLGFVVVGHYRVESEATSRVLSWDVILRDPGTGVIAMVWAWPAAEGMRPEAHADFLARLEDGALVLGPSRTDRELIYKGALLGPMMEAVDLGTDDLEARWAAFGAVLAERGGRVAPVELPALLDEIEAGTEAAGASGLAAGRLEPHPEGWVTSRREARRKAWEGVVGHRERSGRPDTVSEPDPTPEAEAKLLRGIAKAFETRTERRRWLWALVVSAGLFWLSFAGHVEWTTLAIVGVVLLFHELGHLVAMRALGYRDTRILFLPFLGAVTLGRPRVRSPHRELAVLFAGPVPGIALGLGAACVPGMLDDPLRREAVVLLVVFNSFNLLPILPLDGGRIVRLLFFRRSARAEATLYGFSLAALVGLALDFGEPILAGVGAVLVRPMLDVVRSAPYVDRLPARSDDPWAAAVESVRGSSGASLPLSRRFTIVRELVDRLEMPAIGTAAGSAWLVAYLAASAVTPVVYALAT